MDSIADWTDATQYPVPDASRSFSYWAWQFLRRNPQYQAQWKMYVDRLMSLAESVPAVAAYCAIHIRTAAGQGLARSSAAVDSALVGPPLKLPIEAFRSQQDLAEERVEMRFYEFEDAARPQPTGVTQSEFEQSGTRWIRDWPVAMGMGYQWGLQQLENPENDRLSPFNRFIRSGHSFTYAHTGFEHFRDRALAVPAFDLRLPVDVLRGQFEKVLEERERRIARNEFEPHTDRPESRLLLFPFYLRVLDALSAGVSIPDIAKALRGGLHGDQNKTISNWRDQAKWLRDAGYMRLPLSQIPRKNKEELKYGSI